MGFPDLNGPEISPDKPAANASIALGLGGNQASKTSATIIPGGCP
jgi:hypothetical protein